MNKQEEINYLTETINDFIKVSEDNSKKAKELQKIADISKFNADIVRINEWIELLSENTAFLFKMVLNMQERLKNIGGTNAKG